MSDDSDPDGDGHDWLQTAQQRAVAWRASAQSGVATTRRELGRLLRRTHTILTSRGAKWVYVIIGLLGATAGVWYLSWTLAGPIATLVYFFLFAFAFACLPGLIFMFGAGFPGSTALGSLHLILGAFAFGRHVLVQTSDGWDWCPARDDAIYVDGEWRPIEGGFEHWSVLGWRPFAVALLKEDGTLGDVRVDTRAERDTKRRVTATDGAGDQSRGGYTAVAPPIRSGDDGTWVVDLTRLFAGGIRQIGDIELIETAEEIMMREESHGSSSSWWQSFIGGVVGLIIGVVTGYVFIYA